MLAEAAITFYCCLLDLSFHFLPPNLLVHSVSHHQNLQFTQFERPLPKNWLQVSPVCKILLTKNGGKLVYKWQKTVLGFWPTQWAAHAGHCKHSVAFWNCQSSLFIMATAIHVKHVCLLMSIVNQYFGWVTACSRQPSGYVTSHLRRLSLLPSVGWWNE